MLAASIHEHAGLGNQIWRYVCCRVFAETLGYDWGVSHPGWRGPFLNIDWGKEVSLNVEQDSDFIQSDEFKHYYKEVSEPFPEVAGEVGRADKGFLKLEDNTYINGNFQRMEYIEEHRDKICEWLSYDDKYKVTDYASEEYCVIQLRGGDYTTGHSMLPPEYYQNAMKHMKDNNPDIKFVIVTDDPNTAQRLIPGVPIVGSAISEEKDQHQKNISWYTYPGGPVSIDYSILNTAKYAIISASTFAFWPIWTNKQLENVIAPMYWFDWSRSNGWWRPYDGVVNDEKWLWLHRDGNLYSTDTCITGRNKHG
tara:strand:- start:1770 stop:2696 length:927 start_codon:yes stop_codon:yes gene_type:complete